MYICTYVLFVSLYISYIFKYYYARAKSASDHHLPAGIAPSANCLTIGGRYNIDYQHCSAIQFAIGKL